MVGSTLLMILIALSALSPCNGTNDNDYLSSNPESGPYRGSLTKLPISRWSSDIIIKDPYEKYYSLGESE